MRHRRRTGEARDRIRALEPSETTTNRAIPITTPARTIIDLARTLEGRPLEHALDRAEHRCFVDRYVAGSIVTRSEMEERFLALCDDHGLPRPGVNTRIEGKEVDFVWRGRRLIVEVDGYAYHRSPATFEEDRERDVVLSMAGWTVLRFTWTQLTTRAAWVAGAVSRHLDM